MNRFLLIALFACFLVLGGAPGQAAGVKGFKLVQTHIFFGKCEVLLARDGIRVTNQGQFGYVLVSSAPEWKVTVFRTDDKTFNTETLEQFEENGLVSDYHFSFRDRSYPATGSDFNLGGIPAKRISGTRIFLEFLPPSTIQPKLEKVVYGMYKLPTQGGFPLTFRSFGSGKDWLTGEDNSNKLRTLLSTHTIARVVIDPAVFLPPKNYKKVDSMLEVLSSTAQRKETSGSFRDLFGGK